MIIDGMMHVEVVGEHWDGLCDEVVEYYDALGIDKGVVLVRETVWELARAAGLEELTITPHRFRV